MDPRFFNPTPPTAQEGGPHPPPPPPPPPPQPQAPIDQQQPGSKRPHASAVKSRSASSYPRKRAVSACLVCRGRKTKCDNQRPQCGFCRQNGAECVYEAEKLATFDAASLAILDRLSRIEALLDSPTSNQPASHPSPHASSTSGGAVIPSNATTLRTHSPGPGRAPDGHAVESEIFPISIATAAASRVENVLQWPVFMGKISTDDILAPVFANKGEDSEDDDSEDGEGQGWNNGWRQDRHPMDHQDAHQHQSGDDNTTRAKKGTMDFDEKVLVQPPGEIAVLVQRFFRNVHTKNPILDSSELDKYVNKVEQAGAFGWSGKACLLLLVCALGSISAAYNPVSMPRTSDTPTARTVYPSTEISLRYFAAAKKRLGLVMSSNQLVAVQCLFLAGIYHMYTFHQFAAWKMFNAAAVSCEGYLHRKERAKAAEASNGTPSMFSSSEPTRHLEQRIYWSCLKSELELCAELDISHSGLNEVEYPHAFPSPPREISTSQAFQSSNSFFEQPRSAYAPEDRASEAQLEDQKTWFYYLAEIALRKVEIRMSYTFQQRTPRSSGNNHDGTSTSTSSGGDDSATAPTMDDLLHTANEFELQLELWYSCLPPILKFPSDPKLPCPDERLQYLRQRYWWNLSRVYRPFIYYLIHHAHSTHPAHHQMLGYARKGLEIDINFILSNVITHRHHGAWLTLRALTSNSVIILAAKKMRVLDPMPYEWVNAIRLAKSCLSYWQSEVRDAGKLKEVVMKVEERIEG